MRRLCEGGFPIGAGPCGTCGATCRDACRRPLPDPRIAELEAERDRLREALQELRIRYHVAGRRPEECYEMSLIDEALQEGSEG